MALEDKDTVIAKAWEETRVKTQRAEERLYELQETKELKQHFQDEVAVLKKEINDLKASEQEWYMKYLDMSDLMEKNEMKYEKDLDDLAQGMVETKTFLVGQLDDVNERLEGEPACSS